MSADKEKQVQERELAKSKLLMELARHIGRARAIGMGELYSAVYGEDWENRINDTRPLRKLITDLRWGKAGKPVPIASVCCAFAPGYYIATGNELEDYIDKRLVKPALKKLGLAATLRNKALPDLLGQLAIDFQGE